MKLFQLFLLIILFLMVYVYIRGYQCMRQITVLKYIYSILFIALSFNMIFSFIVSESLPLKTAVILSSVGYTFMIVVIYMGMLFLLIDIFRLINYFFIHKNIENIRNTLNIIGFIIVIIMLSIGYYKFNHPKVTEITLEAPTPPQGKKMKIVMASDLHLGNNIRKDDTKKFVNLINAQQPDIVLLVGDIADRSIQAIIKQSIKEDLQKIKSTYGVYGVFGNHEYYGDAPELNRKYYEQSGIRMLFDETVFIDNSFYIVGRNDKTDKNRKEIAEIIKEVDKKYPMILLDHQPYGLEEAEKNDVTIQFSGHTHEGQFFPGNIMVKYIYELPYGYMKKGNTHYYVSSGLGLWGPKYRIGTNSELVVVNFNY